MEPASVPLRPETPNPVRDAALAGLFAILIVYGLILLRDALDTRIGSVEDLGRIMDLPILAEFPVVRTGRRGLPREATSYLRTAVDFATADAQPKIILITSPGSAQGKSSVAMALAESYARQVPRVLLIDADLRKPVIANEYGLASRRGTMPNEWLIDPERAAITRVHVARDAQVDVIADPEPASDPTELLGHGIRSLLSHMSEEYDVIVLDCAPILPVVDALTVAPHVTGVVLCVALPDADRRSVQKAIGLLRRMNVRLLGAVATNLPSEKRNRSTSGYGYGYGYGGYGPSQPALATDRVEARGKRQR